MCGLLAECRGGQWTNGPSLVACRRCRSWWPDGWVGLVEGLTAWALFRVYPWARRMFRRSSSAVIAPVYDGSDEPHHGNEDEHDPHRVDFVKQHRIAAFSFASCLCET
jgi:hypothetical protein